MHIAKAIFLDKASLYPEDLDFSLLEESANWQWFDNVNLADIQHSLQNAEILVTNKVVIEKKLFDTCKHLKLICVAATGVNNVDLAAAKAHDVKVCNVRSYATSSVVSHVFSMILSLNRNLTAYSASVTNGDWSHSDFFCCFGPPMHNLVAQKIGIIGYGELGKAVAEIAKSFGMEVLIAHGHNAADESYLSEGRVDLDTLLSESDVVSLHCPLTENNRYMIGRRELGLMKPEAILINTARGGLIDENALLYALKNNQIAAAGLDVLEKEPPSFNHPLITYKNPNLIITPHIAWAGQESRQKLVAEIAKNIQAYMQGWPRNLI